MYGLHCIVTHLTASLYVCVYAWHGRNVATVEVGFWHGVENWIIDSSPARHFTEILRPVVVAGSVHHQRHVTAVYRLALLQPTLQPLLLEVLPTLQLHLCSRFTFVL
jgi:hypothetical protein